MTSPPAVWHNANWQCLGCVLLESEINRCATASQVAMFEREIEREKESHGFACGGGFRRRIIEKGVFLWRSLGDCCRWQARRVKERFSIEYYFNCGLLYENY